MLQFSKSKSIALSLPKDVAAEKVKAREIHSKPRVFLSYAIRDRFIVRSIYEQIQNEKYDVIYFHDFRKSSKTTRKELIEASDAFVIFVSSQYLNSELSDYEFRLIKDRVKHSNKVITAILEKTSLYNMWVKNKIIADFTIDDTMKAGINHIQQRLRKLY